MLYEDLPTLTVILLIIIMIFVNLAALYFVLVIGY